METYWYCGVEVKGVDTLYSYISDDGELPLESYVMVPFGNRNARRVGIVKSCGEYLAEDAPYPVFHTKHIVRAATVEEYKNQPPLPPFRYYDEDDMDEIDYYIEMEDWDEVLDWACEHQDYSDEETCRKVMECYELCLKQHMPVAALNLGTFYYTGRYVKQDFKKAYELYKLAADAGELRAICNCGYCFYYGRHQAVDYTKAFEYFSLGALLYDDVNCLYKLGDSYLNGYAVEKNEKYAYLLYTRALDRSQEEDNACIADTQLRVGKCLLRGIGTEKNIEKAHALLSYALLNFYQRRKTDRFVAELIDSTQELLEEARKQLDKETEEYGIVFSKQGEDCSK